MDIKKGLILSYILLISSYSAWAQQGGSVTVQVLDQTTRIPITSATVTIADIAGSTNQAGSVTLTPILAGQHQIHIQALGYELFGDVITKYSEENLELIISMKESSKLIETVTVEGRTENQRVKQAPIRSIFIDTRAVSAQATSLTDLMNRSTGIRIRQNGGMGNRPEISINGFQGKAIKYFKDGIPIDYMGDGYNLSSLPVEMLDHIEVYKGVLPVSLGADALGGAINLVSNSKVTNRLKGYYEMGSFGTYRIGLLASMVTKDQKWGYGAELYHNYAKNDYKALVYEKNPETSNLDPYRLPMFHNAYKHYLAEVYASVKNRRWTDELRLSVVGFDLLKEQQHPALMTDAYGALHSKQNTILPSLRYKWSALDNKLRIDQYTSFNILQSQRIDTLHGKYDWFGNFTPRSTPGESRLPSESKVDEKQWLIRTNLSYLLSPTSKIELNHVFTAVNRSGKDPLGPRLQNTDIDLLSLTSHYRKDVLGLSLENSFLDERLQNQLIGKYYKYRASGYQNTWLSVDITEKDQRNISGSYWGITEAIKYKLSSNSLIRASAEYTYRLPEREELFGNNVFVVPNFELNPEKSINLNVGLQSAISQNLSAEINTFYRNTKGVILLIPIQAPNTQYQNQEDTKGYGVDLDLAYRISKNYKLTGNATWQNLRLNGITDAQHTWKNDARLRNTPYFFTNAGASAKYEHLFMQSDLLDIFVHYNFMREFYLETIPKDLEPGGFLGLSGSAKLNSDLIIPNQHLLNAGFTYGFYNRQIHLGAEIRNILNKDVYDYYRVQRPGRSFHIKLTYQL
ncbi:TonB-dependent receptor [Sphingobacterium sp. SYP-B4668]|uniref:TonB-dependent receptor n=1 Tax=Sphingobacterium sp. SYP-B4668 TaxID=2996035 RepID=UPI0022DD97CF|nr:TonB-dependent receptor plug domain-containing protein [Sphingobacterium sp. SYP-B4668]